MQISLATHNPEALTLNELPDRYREIRDIRLAKEKEVEAIKEVETAIKQRMIRDIPKDSAGVFGLQYKAQITSKPSVTVAEGGWPLFFDAIRQNNRLDLMQKRINAAAVMELVEAGHIIPGIQKINLIDVSVTKVA